MPLYNRELSSWGEGMKRDEWEEQILKQMIEMFKQWGIDVDEDDLSRMMNQIQSQLEGMGFDPEKGKSGDGKINLQGDFANLGEVFGKGGADFSDIFS